MDSHAKHGEGNLLKFRYKHTQMRVDCRDGSTAFVIPRSGGLQGDSCMASMFQESYDAIIAKWNSDRERTWGAQMLMARIPGTHTLVQVSRTTFADDLAETNLANSIKEVERVSMVSNTSLDKHLGDAGMAQNTDKEEIIAHFVGTGSGREMQRLWDGHHSIRGMVKDSAKYLGNIRRGDGRTRSNIDRRIAAAKEGYYMLEGFWGREGIPLNIIRRVFSLARSWHGFVGHRGGNTDGLGNHTYGQSNTRSCTEGSWPSELIRSHGRSPEVLVRQKDSSNDGPSHDALNDTSSSPGMVEGHLIP